MGDRSPRRARRLAFLLSGALDALIGAVLLLIGFGLLPLDVARYGLETWHVSLLGGALFLIGAVTFAYNLSRLNE